MKVYQGYAASSGLVLGQVSRVERRTESFGTGPFNPDREQRLLDRAVKTAQGRSTRTGNSGCWTGPSRRHRPSWTRWLSAAAPPNRPSFCSRA